MDGGGRGYSPESDETFPLRHLLPEGWSKPPQDHGCQAPAAPPGVWRGSKVGPTRPLERMRAGHLAWQFGHCGPPASLSFLVMSEALHHDYDDSYPTCVETHSTLRIFSGDLAPDQITEALGIQATTTFRKGDPHSSGRLLRKINGWFYSTKGLTESRD